MGCGLLSKEEKEKDFLILQKVYKCKFNLGNTIRRKNGTRILC